MPEYCRRGPLTSFFLRAGLSICETFCLWWSAFMLDPDAPGETSDKDGGDGGGDVLMLMAVKESAGTMVVTLLLDVFQMRIPRNTEKRDEHVVRKNNNEKERRRKVVCENIQFYPDGTHFIGVDRNLRLAEYLIKGNRSWQFSHIIIEHLIVGDGSSLKEIPTGHVDIVVTTRSLCSMTSLKSTLREIHRVLTPGGRYLFIEHIPENEGTFIRWLQKMLSQTRIWPSLYGGCHLDIHPIVDIKNTGFNHVTWDTFTLEGYVSQTFHLILSRQHVLGVAVR
ncbi:Methyltransferase-like protein 7B [Eufriesea mexicana]|uniref:Methyltransferase-like protein 7B n=1 Tax=Eufriesea mexicana TaxID=516756 RepID=A0A310SEX9_9HYME|nr:Methyltransferase-like protein 7B [Eufriesea mexicana]